MITAFRKTQHDETFDKNESKIVLRKKSIIKRERKQIRRNEIRTSPSNRDANVILVRLRSCPVSFGFARLRSNSLVHLRR